MSRKFAGVSQIILLVLALFQIETSAAIECREIHTYHHGPPKNLADYSLQERQELLARERAYWNSYTTDPRIHNPENFSYLVHGLQPGAWYSPKAIASFILNGPSEGGYRISASYVTSSKPFRVLGRMGFILGVRSKDILAAHPLDFYLKNREYLMRGEKQAEFKNTFREKTEDLMFSLYRSRFGIKILSPAELIQKSDPERKNEVGILNEGGTIRILGLYVMASDPNSPNSSDAFDDPASHEKLMREAKQLATELNIPIVVFP